MIQYTHLSGTSLIGHSLLKGSVWETEILYYKGFPGMSTPVFTVSVCTTVKNKGGRLRYYKRP